MRNRPVRERGADVDHARAGRARGGVAATEPVRRAAVLGPAAVVTVTLAVALPASGLLGGNAPSAVLDTGIVPMRAFEAVPDGEAAAIVSDLRAAAEHARQRRLQAQREAAAEPVFAAPAQAGEEDPSAAATPDAAEPSGAAATDEPQRIPAAIPDEAEPARPEAERRTGRAGEAERRTGRAGEAERRTRRAGEAERRTGPTGAAGRTAQPEATTGRRDADPVAPAGPTLPGVATP